MSTAISDLADFDYCPRLRDMLQSERADLANGESIPIHAASTPNNLRTIRHFILQEKPKATLEIGLAFGASALTILTSIAKASRSDFSHTAIDPFQTSYWKSAAIYNIQAEGMADHFTLLEQDSALALPDLCKQGKKYGLIYVDGSHIFENVFIDFFYSCRLLENRGLILFDDCTDKHVQKVIRFIDKNYWPILQRINLPFVAKKSILKRFGNALGVSQLVAYRQIQDPPREWYVNFTNF